MWNGTWNEVWNVLKHSLKDKFVTMPTFNQAQGHPLLPSSSFNIVAATTAHSGMDIFTVQHLANTALILDYGGGGYQLIGVVLLFPL